MSDRLESTAHCHFEDQFGVVVKVLNYNLEDSEYNILLDLEAITLNCVKQRQDKTLINK